MKLNYTTANGRLSVELEGETQCDLFEELGSFQEVFDQCQCGKCQSTNLRFVTRVVDDNPYHELKCNDCHAKLQFGKNKKGGGLFPKRKDDNGFLPDNGWVRWNAEKRKNE